MGNRRMPHIVDIKSKVVESKNIVVELYDRAVIPELVIKTVLPTVHVDNIWVIPDPIEEIREETKIEKRE